MDLRLGAEFLEEARRRVSKAYSQYPWTEGLFATELNPPEGPAWLQGLATDREDLKLRHTPAVYRRVIDALMSGRQGVVYTRGSCQDLKVLASGTPDVNISINGGDCFVRGTLAADQGMYQGRNSGAKVIPLLTNNPANASNPRIDLVVARINDQFYTGGLDTFSIEMVTGTPGSSPAVPAAPANSLILAQILIPAVSTTVTQANITDRRVPVGNSPVVLDDILVGVDARYSAATPQVDFLNSSGVVTNLLPPGFSMWEVLCEARESAAVASDNLLMRLNGDTGANYYNERQLFSAATAQNPIETLTATSALIGVMQGTSAVDAALSGISRTTIMSPTNANFKKQMLSEIGYGDTLASGHIIMGKTKVLWNNAAVISRVSVLPTAGNLIVGSRFVMIGHPGIQP